MNIGAETEGRADLAAQRRRVDELTTPAIVLAVAAVVVCFRLVTGGRRDYEAHFLGGAGGTLAVLVTVVVVDRLAGGRSWTPITASPTRLRTALFAATMVCVLAGVGTELTTFAGAAPDLLDFVHQTLGACLAGLVLMLLPPLWRGDVALLGAASIAFMVAAFRLVGFI